MSASSSSSLSAAPVAAAAAATAAAGPSHAPIAVVGAAAAEDLSRMEGEYGARMIGALKQMDVLLIGLRGLGVETAKNLLLAGPHSLTLHDPQPVQMADLGANFYLQPAHVGLSRGAAVLSSLGELNPNVNVRLHSGELSAALLQQFDVVCVTDEFPLSTLLEWNAACRSRHRLNPESGAVEAAAACFLCASTLGCSGWLFADFGPQHLCFDDDGVPAKSIVVDSISNAQHAVVTIDGDRHLLNDGDLIRLEEVQGMADAAMTAEAAAASASTSASAQHDEHYFAHDDVITNINAVCEVRTTRSPKRFTIGDTRQLQPYASGGVGLQVKRQITFKHQSLQQQLTAPTLITGYMDFTKFGRDAQLHVIRLALWEFERRHHRLPLLHSQADSQELETLGRAIVAEQRQQQPKSPLAAVELDPAIVRNVSLYARAELSPLCALLGGVLAQEITKQAGKYTPITQWLHFDAFELLSASVPPGSAPVGSRYDHQLAVLGADVQRALGQQRVFLVGCGALGCEYLKQFAMMGLSCDGGELTVTDDDRIELSNLSRQFLFRRKHVGLAKSLSAGEAAVAMNEQLRPALKALETRVEPKTEDVFDDAFWDGLSFVVNALDNQQARKYVDGKCVLHHKPLFESGTLGTQANSGIAKCTLRNFPSDIVHCIEWAREKFDDLFVSGADLANSCLEDRAAFLSKLKQDRLTEAEALQQATDWLQLAVRPSFAHCVHKLVLDFTNNFRDAINDLTHNFPRDARNVEKETGVDLGPFWHGHKRFPQAAEFDAANALHLDYVFHGSNILARVFGLQEQDKRTVQAIAQQISIAPYVYTGATVDLSEEEKGDAGKQTEGEEKETMADTAATGSSSGSSGSAAAQAEDETERIERLTASLHALLDSSSIARLQPTEFEKDVESNHHVDFMTASTNLRAWTYHIKAATRNKVRLVAGKIIPAIATTTAAITGFIGLELLKHCRRAALADYRACTLNLATNVICCENLPDPVRKKTGLDPATVMQVVAIPEGHTVWDSVTVALPSSATLQQLLEAVSAQHHGVQIEMLATPSGTVFYNSLDLLGDKADVVRQRLSTSVLELYRQLVGPIFPPSRRYILFDSSVETDSGDAGIMPIIKYTFA